MVFFKRICMCCLFILAVYITWETITGLTIEDIIKNPSIEK